jgi:hypothetical protein
VEGGKARKMSSSPTKNNVASRNGASRRAVKAVQGQEAMSSFPKSNVASRNGASRRAVRGLQLLAYYSSKGPPGRAIPAHALKRSRAHALTPLAPPGHAKKMHMTKVLNTLGEQPVQKKTKKPVVGAKSSIAEEAASGVDTPWALFQRSKEEETKASSPALPEEEEEEEEEPQVVLDVVLLDLDHTLVHMLPAERMPRCLAIAEALVPVGHPEVGYHTIAVRRGAGRLLAALVGRGGIRVRVVTMNRLGALAVLAL